MTEPRYFSIKSEWSLIASLIEQNITPCSASCSLNVVAIETLSKTASTATFVSLFCSVRGIPSLSNVSSNFGSTSSRLLILSCCLGAE